MNGVALLTAGIQLVNVAGMVAILAVGAYVWRRWPDARGLVLPPALWAGYGVVYYVLVLAGRLTSEALLLWGAIHRMLGIYMILGGLAALVAVLAVPDSPDDARDEENPYDGTE